MRQGVNQQPQYNSDTKTIKNKYVLLLRKLLGSGAYGRVHQGHLIQDQQQFVAIKILPKFKFANKASENYLMREKEISQQLNNPNIVQLLDFADDNDNFYLIQEYCDGGNLRSKLQAQPNRQLKEEDAHKILCQLINGYHSLYQKRVIHRDLKPENILFNNEIAKIADFGFAKFVDDMELDQTHTPSGTMTYCAPEIFKKDKFCSKVDVWSLGCIFYEMLFGKRCFDQPSQSKLLEQIHQPLQFPQNVKVDPNLINLIKQMLNPNPNARISWDKIFTNDLIKLDCQSTIIIKEQFLQGEELIAKEMRNKELQQQAEQTYQKFSFYLNNYESMNGIVTEAIQLSKELNLPKKDAFLLLGVSSSKFIILQISNLKKLIHNEVTINSGYLQTSNQQLSITKDDIQALKQNKQKDNEIMYKINNQLRPLSVYVENLKTNQNLERKLISENDKKSLKLFLANEQGNNMFFEEYNNIIKSCIKELYLKIQPQQVQSKLLMQATKCILFLFHCLYPLNFDDVEKLKADINFMQKKDFEQEILNLLLKHQIEVI